MFTRKTLAFLRDLEANNDRDWFKANKSRYEADASEPMREFIRAMQPRLKKISPHIVADDKKVGGAMMRIHRDTRFSKDKRPYNTFLAARFGHEVGKEAGSLGFYVKLTAQGCTLGAGIWHPDTPLLVRIREAIAAKPQVWKAARDAKAFRDVFGALQGESLKRPPRGFDPEHPHVEDLKRKDFVAFCEWKATAATKPKFADDVARAYRSSRKLMAFLCGTLDLPF